MGQLVLKEGRERSLLRRHPWIFSGAVDHLSPEPERGATVEVVTKTGEYMGRAAYSPNSQIRARVWTFADEAVDRDFFRRRIGAALQTRNRLAVPDPTGQARGLDAPGTACRLIYAESDGLPGFVVDRYGDTLVVQALTAGSDFFLDALVAILVEETAVGNVIERSDADVRALEGLELRTGALRGAPPRFQVITENDLRFRVDLVEGHKTGFYLDQRDNRRLARRLARDRTVLDCFCYTGGFALNAIAGGAASVTAVDSSSSALALAKENLALNHLPEPSLALIEGDVFQVLRRFRDERRSFDMVILDPPKFAPTAAHAERAARAYKDINLLAFKLLNAGGILMTFSCSGGVGVDLFQKVVASAALDADVEAQILGTMWQASDHPVALGFPEASYLKGLICIRG